jgi:ankyrin repeat protein
MLADQPEKRITPSDVVHQLERIRNPVYQMQLFAMLKEQTNPREEGIKTLIDQGFDLNSVEENGWTPLLYLIHRKGNDKSLLKLLQFLIEKGIDVNCKDKDGDNAFYPLCWNYKNENLIDIIRLLIENGIDVNWKNNDGWNALLLLCENYKNENLIDIIRLLIQNGIEVNCKNMFGDYALHFLCRNYKNENLIDIIQLLIENEIDVNDEDISTLQQHYQRGNRSQIVDLLNHHVSLC